MESVDNDALTQTKDVTTLTPTPLSYSAADTATITLFALTKLSSQSSRPDES